VIVAPLICGTLGEIQGFTYGFASAAAAMVVALGAYMAGRRHLPQATPLRRDQTTPPRPPLGRDGWKAVLVLALLIPVIGVAAVANNQIYGAYEPGARPITTLCSLAAICR
jgi:POT family proton-dependent oligopeptide transporter